MMSGCADTQYEGEIDMPPLSLVETQAPDQLDAPLLQCDMPPPPVPGPIIEHKRAYASLPLTYAHIDYSPTFDMWT